MPDNSAFGASQPEEAMSYADFYAQQPGSFTSDYDNFWIRMGDWFSGHGKQTRDAYQNYLDNLKARNDYKATQSANAYAAMREDSTMQRLVKDYEAAGLNPYILLNEGGMSAPSVNSAHVAKYDYQGLKEKTSKSGSNVALLLLAAARLVAALV